jgi:hypothetical protein
MRYDIIERHPQNPLLTAAQLSDLPGGCNSVFNSAVFRYGDGYKAILSHFQCPAFGGLMDEVKIFAKPLSATEIQLESEQALSGK